MNDLPERKRLFHSPPPWLKSGEIFFITICCAQRGTSQLTEEAAFRVMTDALEHYLQAGKFWVHLFLAMPDHLHALMIFAPAERMEKVLRDWKRYVAKEAGVVWQDGFFDHRLRGEEGLQQKADYIRLNPVRAGLVAQAVEWKFVWEPRGVTAAR